MRYQQGWTADRIAAAFCIFVRTAFKWLKRYRDESLPGLENKPSVPGTLREAANANSIENFALIFDRMLEGLFIERMDGNEEIFNRWMSDKEFKTTAGNHLLREIYSKLRG